MTFSWSMILKPYVPMPANSAAKKRQEVPLKTRSMCRPVTAHTVIMHSGSITTTIITFFRTSSILSSLWYRL